MGVVGLIVAILWAAAVICTLRIPDYNNSVALYALAFVSTMVIALGAVGVSDYRENSAATTANTDSLKAHYKLDQLRLQDFRIRAVHPQSEEETAPKHIEVIFAYLQDSSYYELEGFIRIDGSNARLFYYPSSSESAIEFDKSEELQEPTAQER